MGVGGRENVSQRAPKHTTKVTFNKDKFMKNLPSIYL